MLFYYLIWCRKRGGRGVRGVRELGYSSLKFSVIVLNSKVILIDIFNGKN